jgi:hypothetical protein
VVDGYLNLASIAERLDRLVERRMRQRASHDDSGAINSAHGPEGDGITLGGDGRNTVLP